MPTWTYSGDPTSSTRDAVRYWSCDTDSTKPWTNQDAELDYLIGLFPGTPPYLAAAEAAARIIGKLKSNVADKKVGDLSITYNTTTIQFFLETERQLRAKASLQTVPLYVGGSSISDKEAQNEDTDRVQPSIGHQVDGMNKPSNLDPSNNYPWGW